MVLPTATLILVLGIQVLAIQISRMGMVSLAADGARALARGEEEPFLSDLLNERSIGLLSRIEYLDLSVCLELKKNSKVAGVFEIPVTERACARKSGL
ncbi:MAG: hypothetical protein ACOYJ7_04060 [Rhodoluna sp.]